MIYQLSWKILPGLRGMSCSDFRAVPVPVGVGPDDAAGRHAGAVIFEAADDAERDTLLRQLEQHFAPQRFSNNAAAFEAVKSYVMECTASRGKTENGK